MGAPISLAFFVVDGGWDIVGRSRYPGFGLSADDALIAATAIENNETLITGHYKHFKAVKELSMKRFVVTV